MKVKTIRDKLIPKKKHTILAAGVVAFLCVIAGGLWVQKAYSVPSDDKFKLQMPFFGDFTRGPNVFMEIAQTGTYSSLDAPEAWSKIYIDPGRIGEAYAGIFDGRFSNSGADSEGGKTQKRGGNFGDNNEVQYEFYLGIDAQNADGFTDERPCPAGPFASSQSNDMPPMGWYKLNLGQYQTQKCGSLDWTETTKTHKLVVFIRAFWNQFSPKPSTGRVNAFKVAGAYENSSSLFDVPLAGYWSSYSAATNSGKPGTAAYAVQDRISSTGTQGDFVFKFAPDCRIANDSPDSKIRYLHWFDVDYPDFYGGRQATPSFTLFDVTTNSVVKDTGGSDIVRTGNQLGGPNQPGEVAFQAYGGHKYEWRWYNVTKADGIQFWIPYDDYPSLVGCGDYQQDIQLRVQNGVQFAGPGSPSDTITAQGGDTLNFTVGEAWSVPAGKIPGAAPYTATQAIVAPQGGAPAVTSSFNPANAINISNGGAAFGPTVTAWNLPGIGPSEQTRQLTYQYKVKDNAPDGGKYCWQANLSPRSSTDAGKANSNTVCVQINNSLRPYLTTSGGDVHAGGGVDDQCTLDPLKNTIQGQANQTGAIGSKGDYVVSAGGAIDTFGSGGVPNSTQLQLGKGGYYGKICRPNLVSEIEARIASGKYTVIDKTSEAPHEYDLGTLTAGKPANTIIKLPSGSSLKGNARAKVTVYVRGNLTISGRTVGSETSLAASRNDLPLLGIITSNNLNISSNTVGITAQLYAKAAIDTCAGENIRTSGGLNACSNPLYVNGFAMAHSFSFKRTRADQRYGLQLSEAFALNPAFYLSPPPGFDTAAGLVFQGERAPLF